MNKKSLRLAIDTHQRMMDGGYADGSYGSAKGDDRKLIFNKRMKEIEPKLNPCPFCGDLPIFNSEVSSYHGASANFFGSAESVECNNCDIIFKGSYGRGRVVLQWNYRYDNKKDKQQ